MTNATKIVGSKQIKSGSVNAGQFGQMGASDGQVMKWNNSSSKWVAGSVSASEVAADDISAGDAAVTIGNGSTSADVTLDSGADINLDADGGDVIFKDGGTAQLQLDMAGTAGEIIMQLKVDSDDFVFKQYDGTEVFRVEDNGEFDIAGGAGSHVFELLQVHRLGCACTSRHAGS